MAEYAKKETLIKKLIEVADDFEQRGGIMNTAFAVSTKGIVDFLNDKDCSIFEEAKPVVHACWKKKANETKCSNCEFIYYSNHDEFNYCPNCGAQMELVSNTDELKCSEKPNSSVKIPVISMEDVPKFAKEMEK